MNAGDPAMLAGYLRSRLSFEIDVTAAAALQASGELVLIDTRREASWLHGHIAGALHLPNAKLQSGEDLGLPAGKRLAVYGWGPGCNGATQTALVLAERGILVQELLGGFEYWCRNGYPIVDDLGEWVPQPDPLVTADHAASVRGRLAARGPEAG
ncbi:rhodanese-like domain-containing protein [Specibacter sp. RAF43]|uniref:rhodanese-like domain-containing protein n=1 Tax=Specibacter sp. RAF43 TaxID=3233057 RepID=UPI003F94F956